jgi:hypothetical protein
MGRLTVLALRTVLVLATGGALVVQLVLLGVLVWGDLDGTELSQRATIAVVVMVVLGLGALQVSAVCVWRLLTMAGRGTVFSPAAFRYVDGVIGAVFTASLLVLGVGTALAPGEAVAPGVVLLVGGVALVVAGIGLIVLVMRALLVQAVARDAEAAELEAELGTVI